MYTYKHTGERATEEEFLENLHSAAEALKQVTPKVVEFVANKHVEDL